jgi:hypothetical protein
LASGYLRHPISSFYPGLKHGHLAQATLGLEKQQLLVKLSKAFEKADDTGGHLIVSRL